MDTNIIRVRRRALPPSELVRAHLGVDRLDDIHETVDYEVLTRENDQKTIFHERFYEIGDEFYNTYHRLLIDVVEPIFDENLIYQRVPRFASISRATSPLARCIAIATTRTARGR